MLNPIVQSSKTVFNKWRNVPAPERGQLIKAFGDALVEHKEMLAQAITKDMGKTINESRGEVQEAIDMCVFAAGLSRQLYGLTMPSERPGHRLQETWHPLGVIGVITAFNFPVAVWAWNFCLAVVCGNAVIWKPSKKGEYSARMTDLVWRNTCAKVGKTEWSDLNQMYYGDKDEAVALAENKDVALVSATGSVEMGKVLAPIVAARLGKVLLELGGNNASVITAHADIDLAVKGCLFSAIGTTGQRCTTLRRLFVHQSIYKTVVHKLIAAYKTVKFGDPRDESVLLGPIVSDQAYDNMSTALEKAIKQGGTLKHGGGYDHLMIDVSGDGEKMFGPYVIPAIVTAEKHLDIMQQETFAPVLYVVPYNNLQEAIDMVNCVSQGLSNSIYTNNVLEAEKFLAEAHSGIVNVNTSTSGAEIGGAFGGEKDTGGGRESGSDSWKNYMRRVTSTINYSGSLPLAQGVKFE